MKINLTVDSAATSRFTALLHSKKDEAVFAGNSAIQETAELIYNQSQQRVVRVTGALADSGKITKTSTSSETSAIISYGDFSQNPITGEPTAEYAVPNHEHPITGKWLENPLLNSADLFQNNLRKEIRGVLLQ